MANSAQYVRPVLEPPIRWTVCVLAWLAFSVAGYLSWHALDHGAIAGCGGGGLLDCDQVLSTGWSRWFGIPVAFVGLVCYAAIAILCLLLEMAGTQARRWLSTALVLLATIVGGASLWFVLLQVFAIQHFCPYCLVVDACGIVIGALVLWPTIDRWRSSPKRIGKSSATGMKALQSTFGAPTAAVRSGPVAGVAAVPRDESTPSLGIALGGAMALLAMLIGIQVVFPSKTFSVEKVALSESINLTGSSDDSSNDLTNPNANAQTHVAMRIPSEPETGDNPPVTAPDSTATQIGDKANQAAATTPPTVSESTTGAAQPEVPAERLRKERLVSFLDGKLTLDVYKHPLIGSPNAPHVIAEIVSYNCPHCRKMNQVIHEGLKRYGDQLAVIIMVMPMEQSCNRLITNSQASHQGACATARMALGVANLKPSAFPDFHDWLMKDEKEPPPLPKIVTKAYSLADPGRMSKFSKSDVVTNQIKQYVDLYDKLSKQQEPGAKPFGLPVQIMGDKVMTGSAEDKDDIYRAWEENTGVKPKG